MPLAAVHGLLRRGRRADVVRLAAGAAAVVYLVVFSALLLVRGGWPTPDYLIPPLLLIAIAIGRGWSFLFDWLPFLVLILAWQASAGLADHFGQPVHMAELVNAERRLFGGHVPTVELQDRLYHPDDPRWYDWLAASQHAAHFLLPVTAGLVLWLHRRALYWRYVASLMLVFFLGYAGYVLYPAAPPWMAGEQGLIPPVHRIAVETMQRFAATQPVGLAYLHMNANPVAAFPSLHAALPMLVALIAFRLWGWRALPMLLYALGMGYNAVYLGEHYVIDVLAGYAVAGFAFVLVWVAPDLLPLPSVAWRPRVPAVPRLVRRLGDVALAGAGVVAVIVIGCTLRTPSAPSEVDIALGPPTLGPPSPAYLSMSVTSCGEAGPPAPAVAQLMDTVAVDYAVYLIDLNGAGCFALADRADLPPPALEERDLLVAAAPMTPALAITTSGTELIATGTGHPAPALATAGVPADHEYLLVIRLTDAGDTDAATEASEKLAAFAFGDSS